MQFLSNAVLLCSGKQDTCGFVNHRFSDDFRGNEKKTTSIRSIIQVKFGNGSKLEKTQVSSNCWNEIAIILDCFSGT